MQQMVMACPVCIITAFHRCPAFASSLLFLMFVFFVLVLVLLFLLLLLSFLSSLTLFRLRLVPLSHKSTKGWFAQLFLVAFVFLRLCL